MVRVKESRRRRFPEKEFRYTCVSVEDSERVDEGNGLSTRHK